MFNLYLIADFENLSTETVGEQFKDKDVFFCTLGTTRRAAGSAVSQFITYTENIFISQS